MTEDWYVADDRPSPQRERRRATVDLVKLLSLAQEGRTAKEAAEILGCAMWTARDNARQMGVSFRNPRAVTPEQRDQARVLAGLGWTQRAIAEKVGVDRRTVRKILADGVE